MGNKDKLDLGSFVPQLLSEVPEFKPTYEEHMRDMDDELLDYVLMGDFTRFVYAAYGKSVAGAPEAEQWHQVLMRSLNFMEHAISLPDGGVRDLISLGFVEQLLPLPEDDREIYEAIKSLLGPKLRAELDQYEHFNPN